MAIGKPNFDLNSFGIKYLSKDEVKEFVDKREQGESVGTKTELGDAKHLTSRGTTSGRKEVPSVSSTSGIGHKPHPKLFGSTDTKPEPKSTTTAETTSVFNSPTYGVKQIKPKMETPKKQHLGSNIGEKNTDKVQGMDSKGNKRQITNIKEVQENESGKIKQRGNREPKIGVKKPSKLGDAPKDVKGKETKIGQKKVRVGVGEKAHEKLEEVGGVGDKRYASDPKSPYSKRSERKRERESTQSKKLGAAQSKVHELKRRQQIEQLGVKKSNDIITEMNLMKLDLMNKLDTSPKGMKGQRFVKPNMASAGKNPAVKPPNAGGIQDKLETMRDEAPKVTPEKQAKDKKLLETSVTGSDIKVADRY